MYRSIDGQEDAKTFICWRTTSSAIASFAALSSLAEPAEKHTNETSDDIICLQDVYG